MEEDRDYLVYRDAEGDGVSVLVRRRDGHFDLIRILGAVEDSAGYPWDPPRTPNGYKTARYHLR